jgi:hypothetical protein
MPLENLPDWWEFELELSPHLLDQMIDRGFTETDLRLMIERSPTTFGLDQVPSDGSLVRCFNGSVGKSWWSRTNVTE